MGLNNTVITRNVFNKAVAEILFENRMRLKLSRKKLGSRLKHSATSEIEDFETGRTSPKGYQLYELLQIYRNTSTWDEVMFFCCNPAYYEKCLSSEFRQKHSLDKKTKNIAQ